MNGPGQMIDNLMRQPQIANNPRVQEVMRLRKNGDTQGLERLGANICNPYGISFETAANQFQQLMQRNGYRF